MRAGALDSDRPDRGELRQRVFELLKRYGSAANSFQILQSQFEYWFHDDDACVGYIDTGRAWVAAGTPIAAENRLLGVARAFASRSQTHGRRCLFFGTESNFAGSSGFQSALVGHQPAFHTDDWPIQAGSSRALRRQLRRAHAKGIQIERLDLSMTEGQSFERVKREIELLVDRWLSTKRLPPLGFLSQVQPFTFSAERRYFLARHRGTLVGAAVLAPIYARGGWLVEYLLRAPGAPNGTVESLVDAAVRDARCCGDQFVTLGLTPLTGNVTGCLRAARRVGSCFYDFIGLERFRSRLLPSTWSPVYIVFPQKVGMALASYDLLVAFARGTLSQFGIRTLSRFGSRANLPSMRRQGTGMKGRPPGTFPEIGAGAGTQTLAVR